MMDKTEDNSQRAHSRLLGTLPKYLGYTAVLFALGVGLLFAATGGATATQEDTTTDDLLVDLEADGTAVVSLEIKFDLTDADEQRAFEQLQANETKQQELLDRYETRLGNVAAQTGAETDREMSVSDPAVETDTDAAAEVGTVRMSVSWEQFGAIDGERIELGAPLDSGFSSETSVIVIPPEEYTVTAATPEPTTSDGQAIWTADQQLTGFQATVEPVEGSDTTGDSMDSTETDGSTDTDETGPGFGILVAVMATLGLGYVARRRDQ